MPGEMKRISLIFGIALAIIALPGCAGDGNAGLPSPFAGEWSGECAKAPFDDPLNVSAVHVELKVQADGTCSLELEGVVHVGAVLSSGAVGSIPPIGGFVKLEGQNLTVALSRGKEIIGGKLARASP